MDTYNYITLNGSRFFDYGPGPAKALTEFDEDPDERYAGIEESLDPDFLESDFDSDEILYDPAEEPQDDIDDDS